MDAAPLPERVEGPRLVLRRWTVEDTELVAASVERNVEHLRPWMPWISSEPMTVDDRRQLVAGWEQAWRGGGDVVMGIFLGGEVAGGTGLHRRRGPHGLEIGYWVDCDHLGMGVATESAGMLTAAALALDDVDFVEIRHDKANTRSGLVPQRLGYSFVGEAPDTVTAPGEVGIECTWRTAGPGA